RAAVMPLRAAVMPLRAAVMPLKAAVMPRRAAESLATESPRRVADLPGAGEPPKTGLRSKVIRAALPALLALKLGMLALLYRAGFTAFTADDFGRILAAAGWAQAPYGFRPGPWLPFHMLLNGTLLRLAWELLWAPRLLEMAIGLVSLVLMYRLASELFQDRTVGMLSAALLALNPVHTWLSAAPLTELPTFTCLLAGLLFFGRYLRRRQSWPLLLAAAGFALGTGFRFEAWVFSALFSAWLAVELAAAGFKRPAGQAGWPVQLAAALLPWIFPALWMLASYRATGSPLYSLHAIQGYKAAWNGAAVGFLPYLQAAFRMDPFLALGGPPAFLAAAIHFRRNRSLAAYALMALVPFLVFTGIQGGQSDPAGNILRYLASFLFLLYPFLAWGLVVLARRLAAPAVYRVALAALLLLAAAWVQTRAAFGFTNDPSGAGLAVGMRLRALRLRALRSQNAPQATRPALVELSYWQNLAIQVGSNDLAGVVYDRAYDPVRRESQSIFLQDPQTARDCLAAYLPAYVIVQDARIRQAVEQVLKTAAVEEVNGYAFYPVPQGLPPAQAACPYDLAYPE
ncbi:MAG TPA: glycosyltransferase family 39 protein, partial [Anaerolineales bacterium]